MTAKDLEDAINASDIPVAFILSAHLWGRHSHMEHVFDIAQKHGLEVFEDCAESYDGQYKGHSRATISAFSFGTIKNATAFGGALARVNSKTLMQSMMQLRNSYPVLSFPRAIKKFLIPTLMLPFINYRTCFPIIIFVTSALGLDVIKVGVNAFRNFGKSSDELVQKVRHRTSKANLMMLNHRIRNFDFHDFHRVQARKLKIAQKLDQIDGVEVVGLESALTLFWLFTVLIKDREEVVKKLLGRGIIAHCENSQLDFVPMSEKLRHLGDVDPEVKHIARDTIYLPVWDTLTEAEEKYLLTSIREIVEARGK